MRMAYVIATVFLLGIVALGDALQLVTSRADYTKNEGGELEMPCTIEGFGFDMFFNAIIWYKSLASERRVQINTKAIVNEPFAATGRYKFSPGKSDDSAVPRLHLPLIISDISLADNGTYICELWDKTDVIGSVQFNLVVSDAIKELNLTTNATTTTSEEQDGVAVFEFLADEPSAVSCVSRGGNPMPKLRMFRDEIDITHLFSEHVTNTTSGPIGLQVVTYEVTLVSDSFAAEIDFNGQHLKCIAHIHHTAQLREETRALMDVQYPPRFSCKRHAAAELSVRRYQLVCAVDSNPMVDLDSISWTIGDQGNGTNITVGESRDGYAANATVEGDRVTVTLTIAEVNSSSYQPYNLTASNALGQSAYQIILSPVTTTQSPPPTTTLDYRTSTFNAQSSNSPRPAQSRNTACFAARPVELRMIITYIIILFAGRVLCGR